MKVLGSSFWNPFLGALAFKQMPEWRVLFIFLLWISLFCFHFHICTDQADVLYLLAPALCLTESCSRTQRGFGEPRMARNKLTPSRGERTQSTGCPESSLSVTTTYRENFLGTITWYPALHTPRPHDDSSGQGPPAQDACLSQHPSHHSSIKINLPGASVEPKPGPWDPWVGRPTEQRSVFIPNMLLAYDGCSVKK